MDERKVPDVQERPATAGNPKREPLFGYELDAVDLLEAADQVVDRAEAGAGGLVVTMNVDHVVKLQQPGPLREAYEHAALRYADGMPLVWLTKALKRPLPARVAGSDLVPLVLEFAAQRGLRVHLVGGRPEVAAEAERRVLAAYPGIAWTGHVSPPLGFEQQPDLDRRLAEQIAEVQPHLVLVCLGAPKQEAWAMRHRHLMPEAVFLCVGATVDFLAGTTSRAPRWMVRSSLEWAYRLYKEPKRLWRRYLVEDRQFLALAAREVLRERKTPRA